MHATASYIGKGIIPGQGGGVTPPAPTLNALTVSPSSATVGQAYSGAVSGKTSGSALSLSGAGASGLSVVGATISGTPTVSGAVNLIEALAGATNTPRPSNGVVTVASSSIPSNEIAWTPAMASPRFWFDAGDAATMLNVGGTQAAVGEAVETLVDKSANAANAVSAANGAAASSAATRGVVGASETLGGLSVTPLRMGNGVLTHRYLAPAGSLQMVSGQSGDAVFVVARNRPPATALNRNLIGSSQGNFTNHIAISTTSGAGRVVVGSDAGTAAGLIKTDTTVRIDILSQEKKGTCWHRFQWSLERLRGLECRWIRFISGCKREASNRKYLWWVSRR